MHVYIDHGYFHLALLLSFLAFLIAVFTALFAGVFFTRLAWRYFGPVTISKTNAVLFYNYQTC